LTFFIDIRMLKILLVVVGGLWVGNAVAVDGKEVYDQMCSKCHRTGIDGAPKMSDKAEWSKRLAAGKPALIKSVTEGKGEMPARAGKDATDEEISAAYDYIANLVK
jgi:cytochrome c5